jgi:hypothetical protein
VEPLVNSEFCGRVYQQGSDHFNACLEHAFSPNWGTFEALNIGDAMIQVIDVYAELDLSLMAGAACAGICSSFMLLAAPEMLFGAGLWDLMVTYGFDDLAGAALGDVGVTRLEGLAEDLSVQNQAALGLSDQEVRDLSQLLGVPGCSGISRAAVTSRNGFRVAAADSPVCPICTPEVGSLLMQAQAVEIDAWVQDRAVHVDRSALLLALGADPFRPPRGENGPTAAQLADQYGYAADVLLYERWTQSWDSRG